MLSLRGVRQLDQFRQQWRQRPGRPIAAGRDRGDLRLGWVRSNWTEQVNSNTWSPRCWRVRASFSTELRRQFYIAGRPQVSAVVPFGLTGLDCAGGRAVWDPDLTAGFAWRWRPRVRRCLRRTHPVRDRPTEPIRTAQVTRIETGGGGRRDQLFATGVGPMSPATPDGTILFPPLPNTASMRVTIGGQAATAYSATGITTTWRARCRSTCRFPREFRGSAVPGRDHGWWCVQPVRGHHRRRELNTIGSPPHASRATGPRRGPGPQGARTFASLNTRIANVQRLGLTPAIRYRSMRRETAPASQCTTDSLDRDAVRRHGRRTLCREPPPPPHRDAGESLHHHCQAHQAEQSLSWANRRYRPYAGRD